LPITYGSLKGLKIAILIEYIRRNLLFLSDIFTIIKEKGEIMNMDILRFLPIEYHNNELIIQEPYFDDLIIELFQYNLKFRYFQDKIIISTIDIKDKELQYIVDMIKKQRDKELQTAIKKYYL